VFINIYQPGSLLAYVNISLYFRVCFAYYPFIVFAFLLKNITIQIMQIIGQCPFYIIYCYRHFESFLCMISRTELTILSFYFYHNVLMLRRGFVTSALHPGGAMYRGFRFVSASDGTLYSNSYVMHGNLRL
jgi:hypothetical protein